MDPDSLVPLRRFRETNPQTIDRAQALRAEMTEAERALWYALNRQQTGFRFRRQHPVGAYIVDFVCTKQRLIVELDGGQHAAHAHQAYDAARTAFLEAQGFRVLRFWNNDVLANRDGVIEVILAALHKGA